jgi:hypothetical protein
MTLPCRSGLLIGLTLCAVTPLGAQATADPTRPLIAPQPSILCGMRVFPAPGAMDRTMPRTPPAGSFTLQVREPRVCRDTSQLPPLRSLNNLPNRLPWFLGPKR